MFLSDVDDDIPQRQSAQKGGMFQKFDRMHKRDNRKWYLLYPEDRAKTQWDLVVALALIVTCSVTPVRIAFYDVDDLFWTVFNSTIDLLFAVDIIVIFFTATYDDDFVLVDNLGRIATMYLGGWFLLDLLAIFPFDQVNPASTAGETTDHVNGMARIARLGRMYKLIKLTRLIRVLKVIK